MNIPMSWLRDCAQIDADTEPYIENMTRTGTTVESRVILGQDIINVVTGRVLSIEKHPNADKLLITKVDIGTKTIQIVTGATNLTLGDYVPVALDGALLPGGKKIKKGKLRGELSEGMLCGIDELGYTRHDFPEAPESGIYVFASPQPLGEDVRPILELCDEVIDYEILSNRPDCYSVIGVAREAAAVYGKTFQMPALSIKETASGQAEDMVAIQILNTELCPRYAARVVKNVRIEPSPQWLRRRLTLCGVRPINNIVDITNYVMLEYGQPMHAFDIDNIAQRQIVVRNAQAGEIFTTLDGVTRTLDDSMLVIADPEKALAIAGIMGGENSMVTEQATAVLFESANFNGTNTRLTSKKLGLRTEASARFEKGLDPNLALLAVNRAMELIELLQCGEVVPGIADAYPLPRQPWKVPFDPAHINALLGTDITPADMVEFLKRIDINTHERMSDATFEAEIPTFRADLNFEADIAEEVARLYGYDRIPATQSPQNTPLGLKTPWQRKEDVLKRTMTALGYHEALTYPFESPKVFDKLMIPEDSDLRKAVRIQNPLGEDFSMMRTSSLGGLMESLSTNYSRRNPSARLFEMAKVYLPHSLPLTELPEERPLLTVVAYNRNGMDFYDLKGDIQQVLAALGCETPEFSAQKLPHMHPGRTAQILLDGQYAGYLGEAHPVLCAHFDIHTRVYIAVLELQTLIGEALSRRMAYKPLPKYPAVHRDLALRVPLDVPAARIEEFIRSKAGILLAQLDLFDVYQGKQVEEGYKSMAYALDFRASDRTLTDEEVSTNLQVILKYLENLGVSLRDK